MIRFLFLFAILIVASCNSDKKSSNSSKITIFHAGSLSYPFREVIKVFNTEYPYIQVLTESSGSIAGARKITDLNRICDIYATADYKVIESLLYPNHADWYIAFARNELAIVFTAKSAYSTEINTGNWPDIITRPNIRLGRSDPDADPCGYRTLLMWQLAEDYYSLSGFYEKLLLKDTRFIRPKEVDLLALLETNTVDYIFIYRSVAEQHKLKYITLPDSINLGNPKMDENYKKAVIEVKGTTPGEKLSFYGEPMIYAVTIPKNAPNQKHAEIFLQFLINPAKGLRIMEENGQPPLKPLLIDNMEKLPETLKTYIHVD